MYFRTLLLSLLFHCTYTLAIEIRNLNIPGDVVSGDVVTIAVSNSGDQLFYVADKSINESMEIYSVDIPSMTETNLGLPLIDNTGINGSVEISNDDQWMIFVHAPESGPPLSLYARRTSGEGPARRMHEELFGSSRVGEFREISPNNQQVVYTLRHSFAPEAIYASPLDGSNAPVNLTPDGILPGGGTCCYGKISFYDGGNALIYLAEHGTGNAQDLFIVPTDASSLPQRLNPELDFAQGVDDFVVSNDGSFVVFLADLDVTGESQLYKIDLTEPGAAVRLSDAPLGPSGIIDFALSPDDSAVVYIAHENSNFDFNIYAIDLANPTSIRLNDALPVGGDVSKFTIAPDASRVVFVGDIVSNNIFDIASVDITGLESPIVLNKVSIAGTQISDKIIVTPDNQRVIYQADHTTPGQLDLYTVDILGTEAPVALNGMISPTSGVAEDEFYLSSDGSIIFFVADLHVNEQYEIYSSLTNGTNPMPTRLLPSVVAGGGIRSNTKPIVKNNDIFFIMDPELDELFEVYRATGEVAGSATKLNSVLAPGTQLSLVQFSPDSAYLTFKANLVSENEFSYYISDINFDHPPRLLAPNQIDSDSVTFGGYIDSGVKYLYWIKDSTTNQSTLYVTNTDGSVAPLAIVEDREALGGVKYHNSTQRIFFSEADGPRRNRLMSVSITGGTPVQINDSFDIPAGFVLRGDVQSDYVISNNGSYVIYRTVQQQLGYTERHIYRANSDGSGSPLQLDQPTYLNADFYQWDYDPIAERVIYFSNQHISNKGEIFSVPADGSTAPIKLSGTLGTFDGVRSPYNLAPNGAFVLMSIYLDQFNESRLHRANTGGTGILLQFPGISDSDDRFITDDSSTLVFVTKNGGPNVYTVPTDGLTQPTEIEVNPAPIANLDIDTILGLTPDGNYAYAMDDGSPDTLYSIVLDNTAPGVVLIDEIPKTASLANFELNEDKTRIAYVSNDEAWLAYLNASKPAELLNQRMPPGLQFGSTRIDFSPDGMWAALLGQGGVSGYIQLHLISLLPDSDNDGLSNETEFLLQTNPHLTDTDNDGLSDLEEVERDGDLRNYSIGQDTNPLNPDSDDDGISDGDEIANGTDPLVFDQYPEPPLNLQIPFLSDLFVLFAALLIIIALYSIRHRAVN